MLHNGQTKTFIFSQRAVNIYIYIRIHTHTHTPLGVVYLPKYELTPVHHIKFSGT